MFLQTKKISLIYFVTLTLLLVGLVPLVLTGWTLSERSARELRSVENRYQIQLVQEKARQIEMFGQHYSDLVRNVAKSLELSNNIDILSAPQTEEKLGATLRESPSLIALHIKPLNAESLSLFRSNVLSRTEIESVAAEAVVPMTSHGLLIGEPRKLPQSGESAITIAAPVMIDGRPVASVVAIVSLR